MRLTETDMRDLVMVLAWLESDRLLSRLSRPTSDAWHAGRRLAEKVGGPVLERYLAAGVRAGLNAVSER